MQEGDEVTWSGVNGVLRGVVIGVLKDGAEYLVGLPDGRAVLVAMESIGLPL